MAWWDAIQAEAMTRQSKQELILQVMFTFFGTWAMVASFAIVSVSTIPFCWGGRPLTQCQNRWRPQRAHFLLDTPCLLYSAVLLLSCLDTSCRIVDDSSSHFITVLNHCYHIAKQLLAFTKKIQLGASTPYTSRLEMLSSLRALPGTEWKPSSFRH